MEATPRVRSDLLLQQLAVQLPGVFWTTDRELRLLARMGAALPMFRPELAPNVGRSLYDHFGTDVPTDGPIAAHLRALAGEEARYKITIAERTFEVRVAPLRDEHAAIIGCLGLATEATAGRRVEEALRASDERYQMIVETAAEGVWLLDAATNTTYVNGRMAELLGYAAAEMLGRSSFDFLVAEERPRAERVWGDISQGRKADGTWRFQRKDGTVVDMRLSETAIFDPAGTFTGAFAMLTDITAERRASAALAAVRRRLAAGQEAERLRLARDLHDGPLRALVAVGGELAHRQRDSARGQAASTGELGELREAVLAIAADLRNAVGVLRPPGLADGGMPAALAAEVTRLRQMGGPGGPDIAISVDAAAAALPEQAALTLFRVAQEALTNAYRHAAARRVELSLIHRGDGVRLRVRDDGRGFRVPGHLAGLASAGHYGLAGLAERVELAGGRLRIRSRAGAGTIITVWLPAAGAGGPG